MFFIFRKNIFIKCANDISPLEPQVLSYFIVKLIDSASSSRKLKKKRKPQQIKAEASLLTNRRQALRTCGVICI